MPDANAHEIVSVRRGHARPHRVACGVVVDAAATACLVDFQSRHFSLEQEPRRVVVAGVGGVGLVVGTVRRSGVRRGQVQGRRQGAIGLVYLNTRVR